MLIQRIHSASEIDAVKRDFIYELITTKDGRRSFIHRDGSEFDRFIKPNCDKRLFYYVNTGKVELDYKFDDICYGTERLAKADVRFAVRLRPAEDIDAENSFADWIAEGPKEVVTKQDILWRVDAGLKQYFQQVVNGVTTLSLLEGHGAGAIRDEVAFCADAGLPSWLEIVKTSSVQVQGAASKAIKEENKRIENAKARRNKLSEQIDIIVSEEKLEQVKAEIAHRNEMMRKKRELDLARINSLLDEIKIKKEIAKIEKDYVVAIHDVDYQIKCQKLENEKVDGKAKLEDIENKRRESEASIRKIEQDIKESQAKIDDILRKGSIWRKLFLNTYFLLGLTVALCVVSYYFIELYGEEQRELELLRAKRQAEIERQKIKAKELQEEKSRKYREQKEREIARQKAEVTELTLQYEKTYNELKSSYRYYGWRTNSFVTAEKLIHRLRNLQIPEELISVVVITQEVVKVLNSIQVFDKDDVGREREMFTKLEKILGLTSCKLNDWPDGMLEKKRLQKLHDSLIELKSTVYNEEAYNAFSNLSMQVNALVHKDYEEDIVLSLKSTIEANGALKYPEEMLELYREWQKDIKQPHTETGKMFFVMKGRSLLSAFSVYPEIKIAEKLLKISNEQLRKHGLYDIYAKRKTFGVQELLEGVKKNEDKQYFEEVVRQVQKEVSLREKSVKVLKEDIDNQRNDNRRFEEICRGLFLSRKYDELQELIRKHRSRNTVIKSVGSKWFRLADFMKSCEIAAKMVNILKENYPDAYSRFEDYYSNQMTAKALVDEKGQQMLFHFEKEIASEKLMSDFNNLLTLARDLEVDSIVKDSAYSIGFASEILQVMRGDVNSESLKFYKSISTGYAYFRIAKKYRYDYCTGIKDENARRIAELEYLERSGYNGVPVAKEILRKEQGY